MAQILFYKVTLCRCTIKKYGVPHSRIELLAFSLQEKRSTTELEGLCGQRRTGLDYPAWGPSFFSTNKRTTEGLVHKHLICQSILKPHPIGPHQEHRHCPFAICAGWLRYRQIQSHIYTTGIYTAAWAKLYWLVCKVVAINVIPISSYTSWDLYIWGRAPPLFLFIGPNRRSYQQLGLD